jgi:hypothetical protein
MDFSTACHQEARFARVVARVLDIYARNPNANTSDLLRDLNRPGTPYHQKVTGPQLRIVMDEYVRDFLDRVDTGDGVAK